MPRPRKPGSGDPKTRSRHGCKQCKQRKIKCGEQKPACDNCVKTAQDCDYNITLNWAAKTKRKSGIQNHMTIEGMDLVETKIDSPTTSLKDHSTTLDFSSANQFEQNTMFMSHGLPNQRRTGSGHFEAGFIKEQTTPYPSPADSHPDEHGMANGKRTAFVQTQQFGDMPPPAQISPRGQFGAPAYYSHGYKRAKISSTDQPLYHQTTDTGMGHRNSFGSLNSASHVRAYSPPPTAGNARIPPSPVASSIGSDESMHSKNRSSHLSQPDRRMSIESLISGGHAQSTLDGVLTGAGSLPSQSSTPKSYYGVDPGYPDFDDPFNHDDEALNDAQPSINSRPRSMPKNGFGMGPYPAFYKSPGIKVRIPEEFEPLPALLTKKPINLLYFHHFISHTARILVPHDCSGNPFRKILPRMALKDENLMRLLLAYSASHRARLMHYPPPSNRISQYVDGMFTRLSEALRNADKQMSNSTFATAIMLSSLEIISPNAFTADNAISWDQHLSMAANIINERGIHAQTVDRSDEETYFLTRWFAYLDVLGCLSGGRKSLPLFGGDFWADDPQNPGQAHRIDCFFGFSDRCVQLLARIAILTREADAEQAEHFSTHGSAKPYKPSPAIVAKAEKIKKAFDSSLRQRYQACNHSPALRHRLSSNPLPPISQPLSPNTVTTTNSIHQNSRIRRPSSPAPPLTATTAAGPQTSSSMSGQGSSTSHALELTTTNECYHWAGKIYILRRILRCPPSDHLLQSSISVIVNGLGKIQEGGTAEACMLFPIFVAGCEAVYEAPESSDSGSDSGDGDVDVTVGDTGGVATGQWGGKWPLGAENSMRRILHDRIRSIEETGLTQARKARELMERVWKARDGGEENVGWEGLVGKDLIVC